MRPLSISVIVVSFNTKEKLARCLAAIESGNEVIVVDNGSTDGSVELVLEQFPHVHLVQNPENRGFGAANNQGTQIATGDLWLYLNSDAYADPGAITALARAFDDPNVVAAGGRLLNPDRSLQESIAGRLTLWAVLWEQTMLDKILRRFGRGYWQTERQLQRAQSEAGGSTPVPQVMGACMMVRANLETFDERFFLYCEDTELCLRLARHGTIAYVPEAVIVHELGSSSARAPWLGIARYNHGKELYFHIHHGPVAASVCWTLNRTGALWRILVWTLAIPVRPSAAIKRIVTFFRVLLARKKEILPRQFLD